MNVRYVNEFAKGGLTEHGLKEGDKIIFDHLTDENIDIIDKDGNKHIVDLDKGERFADGGAVDLDYSDILNVLKTKIDDSIDEMPMDYENAYNFKGEEVEHESRDGFIPYTDGGYEAVWFEYLSGMWGAGKSLPTKQLNDEMNRQIDYNLNSAKDSFVDKYPEIVEELGLENIDYNSLYEAGYGEEAEMLSSDEMEMMGEDTIMMQVSAFYYSPENDRGVDGKHTIRLFGDVNLESPYHRAGNLDDSHEFEFTFNSIDELETELAIGIAHIIDWFNGDMYNESTTEMKVRRMEEGGEFDDDDEYASGGKAGEKSTKNTGTKKRTKSSQPKMVRQYFEDSPYSYEEGGYLTEIQKELIDRFIQNNFLIDNQKYYTQEELSDFVIEKYNSNEKQLEFSELSKQEEKAIREYVKEKYANGGDVTVKIKDWYTKIYPKDDLGEELNDAKTFEDLWNGINNNKNIYHILGVGDSIIRERLFEHLAEIKGVEYKVIYNKWLESDDEYAKGGFVSKAELVWKKLSSAEKMKFLSENFTPQITPKSQETLVGKAYNFLPKDVKIILQSKYANVEEYAEGGEIQDWMEEALASLIEQTGNEGLDITMVSNGGNEFFAGNDMEEYRVFKSEDDAELTAEDEVREDMEESPENFNQDFIINYIDGGNFFEDSLDEMNRSYAEDIASESDKKYANRLIAEMVENGLLDEDDALSDNGDELAEERIEDLVNLMTEEQMNQGNKGFDYFVDNFGQEETMQMVIKNNLIDIYKASKDAVQTDGIGHFLSSYDGETLYLSDGYVAYRNN